MSGEDLPVGARRSFGAIGWSVAVGMAMPSLAVWLDTREGRRVNPRRHATRPLRKVRPTRGASPEARPLVKRYEAAGGRYYVYPICFNARKLDAESLIAGVEIQGTIPMWEWVGDEERPRSATEPGDGVQASAAWSRPAATSPAMSQAEFNPVHSSKRAPPAL